MLSRWIWSGFATWNSPEHIGEVLVTYVVQEALCYILLAASLECCHLSKSEFTSLPLITVYEYLVCYHYTTIRMQLPCVYQSNHISTLAWSKLQTWLHHLSLLLVVLSKHICTSLCTSLSHACFNMIIIILLLFVNRNS